MLATCMYFPTIHVPPVEYPTTTLIKRPKKRRLNCGEIISKSPCTVGYPEKPVHKQRPTPSSTGNLPWFELLQVDTQCPSKDKKRVRSQTTTTSSVDSNCCGQLKTVNGTDTDVAKPVENPVATTSVSSIIDTQENAASGEIQSTTITEISIAKDNSIVENLAVNENDLNVQVSLDNNILLGVDDLPDDYELEDLYNCANIPQGCDSISNNTILDVNDAAYVDLSPNEINSSTENRRTVFDSAKDTHTEGPYVQVDTINDLTNAVEDVNHDLEIVNTVIQNDIDAGKCHASPEDSVLEDDHILVDFDSGDDSTTDEFELTPDKHEGLDSVPPKSMSQIIKQELQLTLQLQRLERGDNELEITPESPKHYELTDEEIRKKNNRREQNRRSALRCRTHAKAQEVSLTQKVNKESAKNRELSLEKSLLILLKEKLLQELKEHFKHCQRLDLIAGHMHKMSSFATGI